MKFHLDAFKHAVEAFAPVALMLLPHGDKMQSLVPKLIDGINEAQAMKGADGPEKKAHVLAIARDSAEFNNIVNAHQMNPAELESAVGHGIDAVIGAVKAVEQAHVPLVAPPA